MEKCAAFQIKEPFENRGRWLEKFPGYRGIMLELGCGKGRFTVETAGASPDMFFIAVERVREAMVVAMERADAAGLQNVRFIDADAAKICEIFAPGEVAGIYINFPDPWPKKRNAKRRLTAAGFLALYRDVIVPGGELRFKTDNRPLFDWSLEQFRECSLAVSEITNDLHANGPCGVMTDYETKFYAQGVPINRCVVRFPDRSDS